jgi:putative ABC transport system permease protein
MAARWLSGLLTHRLGRLLGAIAGVALTVALLASLGAFIAAGSSSLTRRAIADVPLDWQVQLSPGADLSAAKAALGQATSYTALEEVGYADVAGLSARTGGTVQTTGPGKVLGLGPRYRDTFPAEVRQLTGATQGVLVAQQTAANLHVQPGDLVALTRLGLPPATVRVDGVVDLPQADSLFQAIGLAPGAAPQAPPDNVLLLPMALWRQLFDAQAYQRLDSVRLQLHVRISHDLPAAPEAAYTRVHQQANNLEARLAGSGLVGDNLGARLLSTREDALYARVLFLFLGLPGALLVILLTLAISASGARHRRQEQALLRTRGASVAQILRLEALEALVVGLGGVVLGVALAYLAGRAIAPTPVLESTTTFLWTTSAALVGFSLAVVAVLHPAWVQARSLTVVAARMTVGREATPVWQRLYLDVLVLALGALELWRTATTGYQVVLAPEGVPGASVNYEAFLAPLCLWIGGVLVALRLADWFLVRGRRSLAYGLRPVARKLSGVVAASLCRQRRLITRGLVLVALAVSFAISTAVFNTTYNAQSRVDAELTNGADVTVTGSTAAPPGGKLTELAALPGVVASQPMQHRFAYVGNDLQDLYGIDPLHLGEATNISNAYFSGGNARATLAALAGQEDGVLVSEETVNDFQLKPGDLVRLRVQNARNHQYHLVPFHFVGVAREFPTAPKDSFLVASARYLARQTGSEAAEIVLLRVRGNPAEVAAQARDVVASLPGAKVTDLGSTQQVISSSLTPLDLRGLTRLELTFAVLLVAMATGLTLALGMAERRRTFAILVALGAKGNHLGAFLWSEGLVILIGGCGMGVILGLGIAVTLVKVLTGVFDPPPESLAVPWAYLVLLAVGGSGVHNPRRTEHQKTGAPAGGRGAA